MIKKILGVLTIVILVSSCGSDSNPSDNSSDDNFDRSKILINVADNIVVPAFEAFDAKLVSLEEKANSFVNSPSQQTLTDFRGAWYQAYKSWQQVAVFNIGKAAELGFVNFINIYPLTVSDVTDNITNGTYDLSHSNNHDAQGFPALDYLLYGVGSDDTQILEKYNDDVNANAQAYKKYITDVVGKIRSVITEVINDWKGGYRDTFVASSGNTNTSALNVLVNNYIQYYESRLRKYKIGLPVGNFSATPFPEKVEAFYRKDISKDLALEALNTVKDLFNGTYYGKSTTGESFKSYLEALGKSDLATKINDQFEVAKTQIEKLNANFYQQINEDKQSMTMAYDELQKLVALFKVDMVKEMGISINYIDSDGD